MRLNTWIAACGVVLIAGGAMANPDRWRFEWPDTDFSITSVDSWTEILSGGPSKDGIRALSDPDFISVVDETRIGGREPVLTVEIDGEMPRAYPIRYLTRHEIVNDVIGGLPVAVTFCPLCNSGLVFVRRVDGRVLNFGVSGKLRNSDMVMFDRQTESWWQQATGQGIVGEYTGQQLEQLPAWMESWGEFVARNPQGLVMDEPLSRWGYGNNPYVGYDSSRRPYLYNGESPPFDIPPLMRVVRVGDAAWTLDRLRQETEITENGVRISWVAGQASALDTRKIDDGRDVGTIRVRDAEGNDVPHDVMFAFAFHAFWPDGQWMLGDDWKPKDASGGDI